MRNHKHYRIHRYLYEHKYGTLPENIVVRHRCDNPACINLEHLEEGTSKDNSQDMVQRGRSSFGRKNGRAKLSEEQVSEIKNLIEGGVTARKIASDYGVHYSLISLIKNGKLWKCSN